MNFDNNTEPFGIKILQAITNSEGLIQIERSLSQAIRSEPQSAFMRDLVLAKVAGWIAVPTLDFPSFDSILERQKQTQLNTANQGLYGVILPIFGGEFSAYKVPLSTEGLQEFYSVLGASPFSPVLFGGEQQPDWMIVCMESEFYIVAGVPATVKQLLGCTFEESFERFRTFTNMYSSVESVFPHYWQEFYTYYSFVDSQLNQYQYANPGAELLLTLP